MNYQNLHINYQNGSKNYVMPSTVKPSMFVRLWCWLTKQVPEERVLYNIYFKAFLPRDVNIKKGNIYMDKASGIKLVVLRIFDGVKGNRQLVQLCTLLPLKEANRNKINLPLYLKYLGNTK